MPYAANLEKLALPNAEVIVAAESRHLPLRRRSMPINILMPALSPTMEEGKLAKWLVKEGDQVTSGDVIAEIETDKATMEVEAVDEGTVGKIVVPEGTEGVKVNDADRRAAGRRRGCGRIDAHRRRSAAASRQPADSRPPRRARRRPQCSRRPLAAPVAAPRSERARPDLRLAARPPDRASRTGIDLAAIKGSGPHGRIVKADVEAAKPARRSRLRPPKPRPQRPRRPSRHAATRRC